MMHDQYDHDLGSVDYNVVLLLGRVEDDVVLPLGSFEEDVLILLDNDDDTLGERSSFTACLQGAPKFQMRALGGREINENICHLGKILEN